MLEADEFGMVLQLLASLAIAVALTQVATFSTTIYLHRCATHRANRRPPDAGRGRSAPRLKIASVVSTTAEPRIA